MDEERKIKFFNFVGILKRFYKTDETNYIAECPGQFKALEVTKHYIASLPDRLEQGDCLVFCGAPGSGKTHLGIAIVKAAMTRRPSMSTKYITVPALIRKIRATYKNSGGTVEQIVNELSELKILVIDEVGVEAGKEDTTILFDIIDTRYQHQLPTIIISNLNQKNLTDYIGVRVMDRLSEGKGLIVGFDWKSYREQK